MQRDTNLVIAMVNPLAARRCETALLHGGDQVRVRHAQTSTALAAALRKTSPDIVLIEWDKAEFDRAAALEAMHRLAPDAAIVAVAEQPNSVTLVDGVVDAVEPGDCEKMPLILRRAKKQADESRRRRAEIETLSIRVAMAEASQHASLDGILVTDRRGQVVSLNKRLLELFNLPNGETGKDARRFFGQMAEALVQPDDLLTRLRTLAQDAVARSRFDVPLKTGETLNIFSAPILRGADGEEYLGRVWFFRNLSGLNGATSPTHEEEGLLQALREQDVAGAFTFGRDGSIRYINTRFAEMLGYRADEVQGRNFADFISPDLRDETVAIFRKVVEGDLHSAKVATQVVARAGETVDVVGQWMQSAQGGEVVITGIAVDVTALKRTERALKESEDLYRTVVASMAEGVLVVRPGGVIATCNESAARALGASPAEIVGRRATDGPWVMIHEDGTPMRPDETPSARALKDETTYNDILVGLRRPDGGLRWLSANSRPLYEDGGPAPHAALISFTDVTAQKLDQDALTSANHTLSLLSQANGTVVRAQTEQDLLDRMCQLLVDLGGYRFAWIGLAEQASAIAVRAVAVGGQGASAEAPEQDWEALLGPRYRADAVFKSGAPEITQDLSQPAADGHDQIPRNGSRIVLPLLDQDLPLGLLSLYAEKPNAFTPKEVDLLVQLAQNLSYGIASLRERVRRADGEAQLRKSMEAAVQAVASTLEMRDPYTAGHQRDVARLAVAIAQDIGVPADQVEGIYLASIVHDIGKIHIPIDILSKPGPLTKLEYELIQTHSQVGYDIIKNVDFPWPVALMILQHHERLDGSGYPAGLKEEEILQGARIIAVADVVQAMSMRRPYRGPFGHEAALAEIERGRGRLYDPAAVDACLKLFREKGFNFE